MTSLKTQIYDKIKKYRSVSFVELEEIPGFKQSEEDREKGDTVFSSSEAYKLNIIMWVQVSIEAIEALKELLHEKKIKATPTSVFVYLADGKMLKIPLAKSARKYKKFHWAPCVFNPVEDDQ